MAAERPGDFGSTLREARERKGISLRQIANRTKISIAVLEALERNDISRLPGGIFSRAFVRAYAAEVGLDPEATIQEFVSSFPHDSVIAGHSTSDPIEDRVALESDRQVASTVLWMFVISVPLAGVVLYFGALRRHTASAVPPAPVAAVAPPAESRPSTLPSSPPTLPRVEPAASPAATAGTAPPAPAKASAPEPIPERTVSAAPPERSSPLAPPTAATVAAVPGRLTVGLSARRPVYVSATADGRTVISRLLQPGERASVEGAREIVVTAGDASALAMTLNGADARPLGKAGEVVSTRLTPANFKDYLQNR